MSVPKDRVRYFDSDTVSCLANLARLRWNLKGAIDTNLDQTVFNEAKPIKRLMHFMRQEKGEVEPEIVPSDIDAVLLVKPNQNNRRILAQAAAFFVFGQTWAIEEPNPHLTAITRIQISLLRRDLLR